MNNNPSSSAAPAVRPSPKKTFQDLVNSDQFRSQIALALPKHLTPERFIRVLTTATIKNPRLLDCTQESLFKGIFDCAAAGLEIDGRRAHLVPYHNRKKGCYEAQLLIDYKGIAELVMRSGLVSNIHADLVCDHDEFEYDRGELKKHKIDYRKDRGEPYAVYALIRMKDGSEKVEVMSRPEVERIRARSQSKDAGPWVTDEGEMWKKTVFKRAAKWVPLSSELRQVIESEDHEPLNVTATATDESTREKTKGIAGMRRVEQTAAEDAKTDPVTPQAPIADEANAMGFSPEAAEILDKAAAADATDAELFKQPKPLRCEIVGLNEREAKKANGKVGPVTVVALKGEFEGDAYFDGEAAKLPGAGAVIDVILSEKDSKQGRVKIWESFSVVG